MTKEQSEEEKRQMKTFTRPEFNSTFVSNYRMTNHIKEHHKGRNLLSPERKSASIDIAPCKEKEKTVERETLTIHRGEIENLQDMLLQTGKEK